MIELLLFWVEFVLQFFKISSRNLLALKENYWIEKLIFYFIYFILFIFFFLEANYGIHRVKIFYKFVDWN